MTNRTILVTGNLDLDMTGLFHKFLHVDAVILKSCGGLCFGSIVCFFNFRFFPNNPHPLATTSGSRFKNHRITHIFSEALCFIHTLQQAFTTRHYRYTGLDHGFFSRNLITHGIDHIRGGANKLDPMIITDLGKFGVLCQEPIPRVNRIRIRNLSGSHQVWYIQVRVAALRTANTNGFICKFYMQAVPVSCGINGNRLDPHLPGGADYT